jgi:hypothetical protein
MDVSGVEPRNVEVALVEGPCDLERIIVAESLRGLGQADCAAFELRPGIHLRTEKTRKTTVKVAE